MLYFHPPNPQSSKKLAELAERKRSRKKSYTTHPFAVDHSPDHEAADLKFKGKYASAASILGRDQSVDGIACSLESAVVDAWGDCGTVLKDLGEGVGREMWKGGWGGRGG